MSRRSPPSRLVALLVGAAFVLAPAFASADDPAVTIRELDPTTGAAVKEERKALTYLSLGPMMSILNASNLHDTAALGTTGSLDYAIGLEASLNHYAVEKVFAFGYGAFIQTQLESAKYFRTDLGVQGNAGPAGLELGFGIRQTDGQCATTGSFHAAAFLSAGYLVVSLRISPQLFAFPTFAGETGFGLESGVVVALKLPIALQGRDPTGYAVQANGHAW
jgi:hypothetical protein